MLTIWGQEDLSLCDGHSRREFLQVGALGVGGLTLADLLRLQARAGEPTRTPHKAVIMIYLCGAPPHQDMYDLKPDAPAEVRGEFKPIKTNVPGFDICEQMPLQATIADNKLRYQLLNLDASAATAGITAALHDIACRSFSLAVEQ